MSNQLDLGVQFFSTSKKLVVLLCLSHGGKSKNYLDYMLFKLKVFGCISEHQLDAFKQERANGKAGSMQLDYIQQYYKTAAEDIEKYTAFSLYILEGVLQKILTLRKDQMPVEIIVPMDANIGYSDSEKYIPEIFQKLVDFATQDDNIKLNLIGYTGAKPAIVEKLEKALKKFEIKDKIQTSCATNPFKTFEKAIKVAFSITSDASLPLNDSEKPLEKDPVTFAVFKTTDLPDIEKMSAIIEEKINKEREEKFSLEADLRHSQDSQKKMEWIIPVKGEQSILNLTSTSNPCLPSLGSIDEQCCEDSNPTSDSNVTSKGDILPEGLLDRKEPTTPYSQKSQHSSPGVSGRKSSSRGGSQQNSPWTNNVPQPTGGITTSPWQASDDGKEKKQDPSLSMIPETDEHSVTSTKNAQDETSKPKRHRLSIADKIHAYSTGNIPNTHPSFAKYAYNGCNKVKSEQIGQEDICSPPPKVEKNHSSPGVNFNLFEIFKTNMGNLYPKKEQENLPGEEQPPLNLSPESGSPVKK